MLGVGQGDGELLNYFKDSKSVAIALAKRCRKSADRLECLTQATAVARRDASGSEPVQGIS